MRPKAFIPIRHDEAFICLDNIRDGSGVQLWRRFIQQLSAFDVFVDTDSVRIKDELESDLNSHCKVYLRDRKLLGNDTTTNDLIVSFLDRFWIQHETLLQTHITHPFLTGETLARAWNTLDINSTHDSIVSADQLSARLWSRDDRGFFPINHNPMALRRTRDLAPFYQENSAFYVFSAARFRAVGNRLGLNPLFMEITQAESITITNQESWRSWKRTSEQMLNCLEVAPAGIQ